MATSLLLGTVGCIILHTLLLIVLIATPTFGDLIDLLEEAEDSSAVNGKSVSEVLYSLFQMRYPHVTVGRPQRLYDAAKRIAGPTRKSLRGASKLSGSSLSLYRAKEWLPRNRTQLDESNTHFHYFMNNITTVDPSHFVLCSFRYRACFSNWIIIVRSK